MSQTSSRFRSKFIGDRNFYRKALTIAVPLILQNGITNFVNMLDNIMVGRVGMEQMSGVAIVNQLLFVFNLCIFGGLSGIGIFTTQYCGLGDQEGIRQTVRFKIWLGIVLVLLGLGVALGGGAPLIRSYLSGSADGGDLDAAFHYGMSYLRTMLVYMVPFVVAQIFSSTLRENGETMIPMTAGVIAVFVNLGFNYVLIYGKFGFPELGVVGAAVATVLARFVEMGIVLCWTFTHPDRMPFIRGLFRTMRVPLDLVKRLIITGFPLLVNETMWAAGMAMLTQCYSMRGLTVVAGFNIANTISNVFNTIYLSMGHTVGIMVGQLLGANRMEEARDADNKLIFFALCISIPVMLFLLLLAPIFPDMYNTSTECRILARNLINIQAIFVMVQTFVNACYFTLRCGGKTVVTFLFDSVFVCCVSLPVAFVLSRFTDLNVLWIFVAVQLADMIKCIVGFVLVKKGVWMQNLTMEG